MTAHHLRYVVQVADPPGQPAKAETEQRRLRGYGLFSQYSATNAAGPAMVAGTNDYYVAHLPAAEQATYVKALRGDPSDRAGLQLSDGKQITFPRHGCEAQARERLYGSVLAAAQVDYVTQVTNISLTAKVKQDPEYVDALAQWSTCMAVQSYRFGAPEDATKYLTTRYLNEGATPTVRDTEIAIALRDSVCAEQVKLPVVELSLRRMYLNQLPSADLTELQRLAKLWRAGHRYRYPPRLDVI